MTDKKGSGKKNNHHTGDDDAHTKKHTDHDTKQEKKDAAALHKEIAQLQKDLEKAQSIAAQTQRQYLITKQDFDAYQHRVDQSQQEQEVRSLVRAVNTILPAIDKLHQIIQYIPEDLRSNSRVTGVQMIEKLLQDELHKLHIFYSSSIGQQPDMEKHQPVGTSPVDDASMVGLIVQEVEPLVEYNHDGLSRVVRQAKVLIGVSEDASDIADSAS